MTEMNKAFDDFVDECLLEDDALCTYENKNLDEVLESLVSMHQEEWEAFQDLAA